MKIKNGFTLIELLAVIIILGIIALIAVPIVNKILDDAKRGSFEVTIRNIERKVSDTCNIQLIKGIPITSTYTIEGGYISPDVDIKGNLPDGIITVDNKCNTIYQLTDKTYMAIKDNIDSKPEITKCNGKCKFKYVENELNGAIPKLDSGMIPVTIGNDGSVKKADLYSEWYKYDDNDDSSDNSKWANAILVTDTSREMYMNAEADSFINIKDILAYLVWIPRFSYIIPVVNDKINPPLINIKFENKNTIKKTGNATGSDYYTHPAFTFDNKELNGIWVGKFETTGNVTTPTSLPNLTALMNQNVSVQYTTAQKFGNYGVNGDAHMMKNTEWGALAYLSHSKYGSNNEIRINNNRSFTTGCGASANDISMTYSCYIQYGNASSYPQSTTSNITGAFDMSGGAIERVMGNYKSTISDSGFIELPDLKYYNLYNSDNYENACNGTLCKGHALYETEGWYNDYYDKIDSSYPWVNRGGNYNATTSAGIFSTYAKNKGESSTTVSFRVVYINEL